MSAKSSEMQLSLKSKFVLRGSDAETILENSSSKQLLFTKIGGEEAATSSLLSSLSSLSGNSIYYFVGLVLASFSLLVLFAKFNKKQQKTIL